MPPEGGLWAYAVSRFMSMVTFHPRGLVSGDSVPAIVARTTYYLECGDLEQATRELNQLRGTPRAVAYDWLVASRATLEARQALDICRAHTALIAAALA